MNIGQNFLFFLTAIYPAVTCCQVGNSTNPTYLTVIGSSPNVSALNKYGETPVSYYTGVPDIKIPIYTIQEKDLTLPIYLSYHSAGIKVDEEASRVGLGWVLQGGGEISRSVRGGDDFNPQYGYLNNTYPESINPFYNVRTENNSLYPSPYCNVSGENFSNVAMDYVVGTPPTPNYDMEPDDYRFNIGDYSGEFIISKNKNIVLSKPNGLEIKCTDFTYNNNKWQIRKPDGTVLLFQQQENTTALIPLNHGSYSSGYTTVWYLTKVISPSGVTVTFNYSTTPSAYINDISKVSQNNVLQSLEGNVGVGLCGSIVNQPVTAPYQPQTHDIVTLNSINYDYGQINFSYSSRVDIQGDVKLDEISVINLDNSIYNTNFLFNNGYFIANDNLGNGYAQGTTANLLNKRLKLISLQQTSPSLSSPLTYQFQYNETYLPQKDNFARDFWGFYNGAYSNSSLLPTFIYGIKSGSNIIYNTFNGANRGTNINFAQAFILTQIKYPTGGQTNYDYESNDFDVGNSINPSYIGSNYEVGLTQHVLNNTFLRGQPDQTIYLHMRNELPDANILYFNLIDGYGNASYVSTDPSLAYLKVYPKGSSTAIQTIQLGRTDSWTNKGGGAFTYTGTLPLAPGEYNLVLHVDASLLFLEQINISTNWMEDENRANNHSIKVGGGLRIKRITDISDVNNQTNQIVKRFQYNYQQTDSNGILQTYSYGRKMAPFQFFNIDYRGVVQNANDITTCQICNDLTLYSNSVNDVDNIGYDNVTVCEGENGENGKTVYSFTNTPDQVLSYIPNSNIHMWDNQVSFYNDINTSNRSAGLKNFTNVQNGDLIHKVDYSFDPVLNQFKEIHEIINSYSISLPTTQSFFGYRPLTDNFDRNYAVPDGCFAPSPCFTHLMQYPAFEVGFDQLTNSTERTYDPSNPTNFVEQKTVYLYEQGIPVHFQPIQTTTYRSDNITQNVFKIYPSDYPSGTPFIDNMITNHVISRPIESAVEQQDASNNISILRGIYFYFFQFGLYIAAFNSKHRNNVTNTISKFQIFK